MKKKDTIRIPVDPVKDIKKQARKAGVAKAPIVHERAKDKKTKGAKWLPVEDEEDDED